MSRSKDWRRRRRVCLVNGKHTPGSPWERECPLLNRQAPEGTESDRNEGAAMEIAGRPETPSPDPHKQRGFGGRFLSPAGLPENSKRAGGRPRKHSTDAAAHAAAQHAYRQRRQAEQVRRNDELANGAAAA